MPTTNLNTDRLSRRTKPKSDFDAINYGKVQPQARTIEEAVLGAVMLEKSAFDTVIEILKPECFYVDAHQKIFKAFISLANTSQPIDILTVVEQLKQNEDLDVVGGPYFVTKLTNTVVSTAHIEAHARIVLQKYIQRELIRTSGLNISEAFEDSTDVFDLLDQAEGRLFEITNNHLRKNYSDIQTVLANALKRIEDLRNSTEDISGVASGFPSLDKVTFGWQPSDLIILAARPAVGKTAFALNLARNAAMHPTKPTPVVMFSLEMSAGQLVQRILSAESGIWLEKITRGKLEDHEMQQLILKGVNRLDKAPIFIDDTPSLNIFELRAKCRRLKNKQNIGLVIIDYLQLMSGTADGKNGNREQEISAISRNLKALAKELNVPIIALSQLSRDVEKRKDGNKIPQLSDLRESGAIEQDADMVMFLYRPEYHDITQNEHGEDTKGETHVRIAKHRNGSLENIKLRAQLYIQKFVEDESFNGGANPMASQAGNWKPVPTNGGEQAGGAIYKQVPSKMNNNNNNNNDFINKDADMPF